MDLNAIANWFQSLGIHPVLGGFIVGVIVTFLVRGKSGDKNAAMVGASHRASLATDQQSTLQKSLHVVGLESSTINVDVNGKQVTIPQAISDEILKSIKNNHKIDAIKLIREATGLDLKDSKLLAETLEKTLAVKS